MSDLARVPGPTSPLQGASAKLIVLVVVGVLVAIVKPWAGSGIDLAARPTATNPSASIAARASIPAIVNYNPDVFGLYEPGPAWELWPAGLLVSFGFAMRIDGEAAQPLDPSGARSMRPSAQPSGSPSVLPDTDGAAARPAWPSVVSITPSSHLTVIGINMPLGFDVDATLWRFGPDGSTARRAIIELPSPWPTHFTVIGMDDGTGLTPRDRWPPGRYRLDLHFEPGDISREVVIAIGDLSAGGSTPAPSGSPGVAQP